MLGSPQCSPLSYHQLYDIIISHALVKSFSRCSQAHAQAEAQAQALASQANAAQAVQSLHHSGSMQDLQVLARRDRSTIVLYEAMQGCVLLHLIFASKHLCI